jgi:hypothetical protein
VPIRTNRGRAAVYRRLWGWPMRSPKHLVVTLVVIAAVVTTIGLIVPRLTGSAASPSTGVIATSTRPSGTGAANAGAAPGTAPTTSAAPTSLPTRQTTSTQTTVAGPADPQALDVARIWTKAWVTHPEGITNEQWLAGLAPYTTEEYVAAVMSKVDPANIAATEVTGPPAAVTNHGSSVVVTVPTNAGALTLTIILTPRGWRVAQYKQAN